MIEQYITPALVVAVGIALWRLLGGRIDRVERAIDRLNERLDRHLEGHPESLSSPSTRREKSEIGRDAT